jgi:hypothetical protein
VSRRAIAITAAATAVALLLGGGCAKIFGLDDTPLRDGDGGADPDGAPPGDGGADAGTDAPQVACEGETSEACYTGPDGTLGQGPCVAGLRTCLDTGFWGPCEGEVTPAGEICGNGVDEDCTGVPDDIGGAGSIDFPGNGLDDDCDGTEDNVLPSCDESLPSNSTVVEDYARAIGACVIVPEESTAWGLITAQLTLASGAGTPNVAQHAIRPALGATTPREGASMLVLSTGTAAAPGQADPLHVAFEQGSMFGTTSTLPADWLAAHGNNQPTAPGCPNLGNMANDPVMLVLRLRTPTNARAFRLRTNFFSTDYPEFMCGAYNDMFVALLDSSSPSNPADKNLAFVSAEDGQQFAMTTNVTMAGDFLRVCQDIPTSCPLNPPISTHYTGCIDDVELIGTGFDVITPAPLPGGGTCGTAEVQFGAGTGWMITQGNVEGGEVITLRLAIWDNADQIYDAMALVDALEWLPDQVVPGTFPDL